MNAHGLARTTLDLDFVVELAGQPALVAFMESLGYETLHVSAGFSNHLHGDSALGRIDFIYVDRDTADLVFAACSRVPWAEGLQVVVPAAEHLIAMKVHAIKNDPARTFRELADIQFLMGRPGVDLEAVKGYFDRAGLTQRYDELVRLL